MDFSSLLHCHQHIHSPQDFLHSLYFSTLSPTPTPAAFPFILGEEEAFWTRFNAVALDGSKDQTVPGWVVVVRRSGEVEIRKELGEWQGEGRVLLVCDLWEHAYYLKYHEDVTSYLQDWRHHLNWSHLSSALIPKL